MNPAEWLARTARDRPDAPALFVGTRLVADYAGFAAQAAAIGAALVARGIGPGDRVAIFLPNSVDYLPIFYGILYAGATAVPVNGKLHAKEAAWIIAHSGTRFVFAKDPEALLATGDIGDTPCIAPGSPEHDAMLDHAPPALACADGGRGCCVAVLYLRHDGTAQGGDADLPEPDGGFAELPGRCR